MCVSTLFAFTFTYLQAEGSAGASHEGLLDAGPACHCCHCHCHAAEVWRIGQSASTHVITCHLTLYQVQQMMMWKRLIKLQVHSVCPMWIHAQLGFCTVPGYDMLQVMHAATHAQALPMHRHWLTWRLNKQCDDVLRSSTSVAMYICDREDDTLMLSALSSFQQGMSSSAGVSGAMPQGTVEDNSNQHQKLNIFTVCSS